MSRKCTIRERVGTSPVESAVDISVSHFGANINLSSTDITVQENKDLFFSGSFNMRIPILFICIFVYTLLRISMSHNIM